MTLDGIKFMGRMILDGIANIILDIIAKIF
jgi:hypothetical protein